MLSCVAACCGCGLSTANKDYYYYYYYYYYMSQSTTLVTLRQPSVDSSLSRSQTARFSMLHLTCGTSFLHVPYQSGASLSSSFLPSSCSDTWPLVDFSHGAFQFRLRTLLFSKSIPSVDWYHWIWPLVVWQSQLAVVLVSVGLWLIPNRIKTHCSIVILTYLFTKIIKRIYHNDKPRITQQNMVLLQCMYQNTNTNHTKLTG